ncbi:hypothetical protein JIN85_10935 [Luteolibacter pohnpeiensis]|uniref:Uncharacterized protein n=1 Tax=Luteolibacter pohnpeiensis TaxID=454153 RepID=A0A934VWW1_9BACT|nr:hypothetical protein [Luteolibacter pohnpeiensis]MBK1882934.1 hypothetical protein [Luteolibacter pohnpeiensis]
MSASQRASREPSGVPAPAFPGRSRRRSGIVADVMVDRGDVEKRELKRIGLIVAAFVFTISLILGVALFLQDWRSH